MNRSKATELTTLKRDIEREDEKAYKMLTKPCEHGIQYAYYFPFKCEKCSYSYVKYCIENNLTFQNRDEYKCIEREIRKTVYKNIEKEKKKAEAIEKQIQENIFFKNMKNRDFRIKNCIDYYRNHSIRGTKEEQKEEVGRRFERQVGYTYEQAGFDVVYNGIYRGVRDKGIDLIVKENNKHIIIQCKNYAQHHQIHENTITQLLGTISTYVLEHPDVEVHKMLITSNDNLDDRARVVLSMHNIVHIVKPYSLDYPLIKCKKESMIYHLPCNANYDRIKMSIKKGDIYLESEKEAVGKGFRPANN